MCDRVIGKILGKMFVGLGHGQETGWALNFDPNIFSDLSSDGRTDFTPHGPLP